MNLSYAVSCALTGTLSFLLGIFVYFRNRSSNLNRICMFLNLGVSFWSWSIFAKELSYDKTLGLLFVRLAYAAAILIPPFFFHFANSLIRKAKNTLVSLFYIISLIFLLLNLTPLFIKDVKPMVTVRYYGIPGVVFPFFVVCFFAIIGYSHLILFEYYKKSEGLVRNQIRYVLIATVIGFVGGVTTFLPNFNIAILPFGFYLISVYVVITSYAIAKHRLMDISFVFKKGTTYFLLMPLIFVPSFLLILLGQKIFLREIDVPFSIFVFSILLLAAIFFYRIKPGTEKAVEQLFFRKHYDYRETLGNFSKTMVSILDLKSLQERVIETITRTMGIEKASLFLFSEEKGEFCLSESRNVKMDPSSAVLSKENPLVRYLQTIGDIIIREELAKGRGGAELNGAVDEMTRLKAEVSIPLLFKGRLVGIINVSHKFDKEAYSHEDIDLLNTLANQTAIAIENARLYEDLKKSKSYMRRADRLASLGTLTAGLAHEIRNPLVAIKTLTQLLPERLEDEEFRNHFLNIASGEVDRISSLVNELLEFARPSDPKLELENINTVLDGMILLVSTETKKKGIEVSKDYASDLPLTQMDREQMKQVFLNILLNAIEATEEHGAIAVRTRPFTKPNGESYVQIEFKDTGCGIPEEQLEDIFNPFFSTKKSGSGLGLTISNQIVQDHRGYIHVESRLNQGTSFFVNLPVIQEHLRRRKDDKS